MVNNEMSEDMLGETGDGSGDCTETSASSSDSQPKSESSPSAKEADEPASSADENVRLSPTSLFCSVPLNRDVQTIIDTFPKTEAEKAGKKTRKIPCLYCDRTFVADNLRQKHVERSHSIKQARRSSSRFQQSIATVTCLFCNKFTLTENKLNDLFQHLVTAHPTKYFGCLPCQERFSSLTQLEEHNDHSHGITREVKVQSTEEVSDMKTNSAITDNSVVKTRHKAKIKDESEQSDETKPVLRRGRQQVLQKELKHKKIAIKSTKLGIKRSVRLQTKVVPNKGKKRPKPKERVIEEPKLEKDKEVKVSSTENPYPTFDAFYRVKKITDHSIDNLRITSLTFNDVFDQAFYNRIKCNIRENLLNHLDGKLFKNEESESRISNFEKTQPEFSTSENYGCEISLNAATPVAASLLTAQFGDDPESQIEYGSKASKKKSTPKQDEVHYKYFTRRKYQASILESKENRDLSKLDMWTQLVIKRRQQKILKETKSDREKLDYKKGEEYRAKKQNQELNRILDRRGPFEDLKEEASKKAALEGNFNQEAHSDVTFILDDILGNIFSKVIENVEVKTELTDSEIPSYLNLRKASLSNESYVDKSDKITLICSSQETENFEAPDISPKDKNALVELTGEWARSRLYICAACGVKMPNIKLLIDHKNLLHQNVWCQHYEFVGNQGEFYKHLSIPGLGKMERIETNCTYKVWKRSEARNCTKCKKQCNSLGELHRHVLECGEDWSWMLVRKKCKYKPFGAKTRKKRRGLFKRIIHKDKPTDENREKKTYKKEGPRVKPSDADTIERMLANLPAKRATRKIMSLKDGFPKISRKTNYKKKTPETPNKVVNIKSKKQNMQMRRDRGEILIQDTQTILKGKRRLMKCNPVNNLRKSMRNLNKVISSAIIDNNSSILVKRKLKNAMKKQRMTRRSQQSLEQPLIPKESVEEEIKKPNKKPPIKKKPVEELEDVSEKQEEFPVRNTRSTSSLPDLEEAKLESPAKKKNKFGKKLMRTLSLRRTEQPSANNEKQTATLDTENTKNNGKRKSKLETLKNAVKKIRLVKENLRSQKQSGEVLGGHFLEDGASSTAAETVTPVLCGDKENESEQQIKTPEVVEVGVSVCEELVEEEKEKVTCGNNSVEETEAAVSACDPVTQVNEVCDDASLTVKLEKVSVIPKTKLCKRNKGLNACIAMLTSKLQQKEVEPPINPNITKTITEEPCIKVKEEIPELTTPIIPANEVTETLEPVDQNKPQSEIPTEEELVPEKSPEMLKTFNGVETPVEEKENIVLEQKPVEQNSPKKEEVRVEKVVDIIKCFEDMNSKENINGHNKKTQKKSGKKLGGNKKKPGKTKLNLISENVIPSVEEQLNTAILEDDNHEIQRDVAVRKLGQRRTLPKRSTKAKQGDIVEPEKPTGIEDDSTTAPKPETSKTVDPPIKPEVKKLIKEPKLILDSNFKIQTPINFTEAKELKTLIQPVFSFPNTKPPEVQNFANLRTPSILNFPNPKPMDPIIKPPILKDVFTFSEPQLSENKTHLIIKPPVMKDIFGFHSEIKQPVIKNILNLSEKPDLIKSPILKDVFSFPEHRTSDLMVAKLFNPLQKINGLSKPRSQSFGIFDKPDNKTLNTSLPNLQTNLDEPDVLENKSVTKQKHCSDSEDEIPLAVLAKEVLQSPKPVALPKENKNIVLQIPTVKTKENKPNIVLQIPSIKSKTGKKHNEDSGVELTPKDQTLVSEKDIIQSFANFIKQNNVTCTRSLFADTAELQTERSVINNSVTDLVTTRIQQKDKKKGKKKGKLKKQLTDDLEESFMEHKSLLEAGNIQKKKSKKKKNNEKLDVVNTNILPETVDMSKKIEAVTEEVLHNDTFLHQKNKVDTFEEKSLIRKTDDNLSEKIESRFIQTNNEGNLQIPGDDTLLPRIISEYRSLPEKIENKSPIKTNDTKLPQKNSKDRIFSFENEDRFLPEAIEDRLLANNIEIRLVPKNCEDIFPYKTSEDGPFTQRNEVKSISENNDGTYSSKNQHKYSKTIGSGPVVKLIESNKTIIKDKLVSHESGDKFLLRDDNSHVEQFEETEPALISEVLNTTIETSKSVEGNIVENVHTISDLFRKPEPIITKITIPKIHIIQNPDTVGVQNLDNTEKSRKSKKREIVSPRHRKCKKTEPIIKDAYDEILQLQTKKRADEEEQDDTINSAQVEDVVVIPKNKKDKSNIIDKDETTKSSDIEDSITTLKEKKNKIINNKQEESQNLTLPIYSDQDNYLKSSEMDGSLIQSGKAKDISVDTNLETVKYSEILDSTQNCNLDASIIFDQYENEKSLTTVRSTTTKKNTVESIVINQEETQNFAEFKKDSLTKPRKKGKTTIASQDKILKFSVLDNNIVKSKKKKCKPSGDEVDFVNSLESVDNMIEKNESIISNANAEEAKISDSEIDDGAKINSLIISRQEKEIEEPQAKITKLIIDKRKIINFEPRKSKNKKMEDSIPAITDSKAFESDCSLQELISTKHPQLKKTEEVGEKFDIQEPISKIQKENMKEHDVISQELNQEKNYKEESEQVSSKDVDLIPLLTTNEQQNNSKTIEGETSKVPFVPQKESNEETRPLEKVPSKGKKQRNRKISLVELDSLNDEKVQKIGQQKLKTLDLDLDEKETPQEELQNENNDDTFVKNGQPKVMEMYCNEDTDPIQNAFFVNIDENLSGGVKIATSNDTFVKIRRQKTKRINCLEEVEPKLNAKVCPNDEIIEENMNQHKINYYEEIGPVQNSFPELQKVVRSRKQKNKKVNYNEDAIFFQLDASIQSKLDSVDQNYTDEETPLLEKTSSRGRKQKNKKVNYNEEAGNIEKSTDASRNTNEETEQESEETRSLSKGRKQKNKKPNYIEDSQVAEELSNFNDLETLAPKGRKQKNKKINYIEEPEDFLELDVEKSNNQMVTSNETMFKEDPAKKGRKQKNKKTNYMNEPEDMSLHDFEMPYTVDDNNKTIEPTRTTLQEDTQNNYIDESESVIQLDTEKSSNIEDNQTISSFVNITKTTDSNLRKNELEENMQIDEPKDLPQLHPETLSKADDINQISFSITHIVETAQDELSSSEIDEKNKTINYINEPERLSDLQGNDQINIEGSTTICLKTFPLKGRKQKNKKINYIEEPEDFAQFDSGIPSNIDSIQETTNDEVQKSIPKGRKQKKINYSEDPKDNTDNNLTIEETEIPELQSMTSSSKGRKLKNKKTDLIQKTEDFSQLGFENSLDIDKSNKLVEDTKEIITSESQNIRAVSRGRKQKNKKIIYLEEPEEFLKPDSEKPFDLDDNNQIISSFSNCNEQISSNEIQKLLPRNRKQKNRKHNYIEEPEDFQQLNFVNPSSSDDNKQISSLIVNEETKLLELQPKNRKQKNKKTNYIEEPEEIFQSDTEQSSDFSQTTTNAEETSKNTTMEVKNIRSISRSRKQKNKKIHYNEQTVDFLQHESETPSKIFDNIPSSIEESVQELYNVISSSSSRGRKQKDKKINYNEEFEDFLQISAETNDNNQSIFSEEPSKNETSNALPKGRKQKNQKTNDEEHDSEKSFNVDKSNQIENMVALEVPKRDRKHKNKKINYNEESEDLLQELTNMEDNSQPISSDTNIVQITNDVVQKLTHKGRKQKNKKDSYIEESTDSVQIESENCSLATNEETIRDSSRSRKQKNKKINYDETSDYFLQDIGGNSEENEVSLGQKLLRGRKQKNKKTNYNEDEFLKLDSEESNVNEALKAGRQKNKTDKISEEIIQAKSKKQKMKKSKPTDEVDGKSEENNCNEILDSNILKLNSGASQHDSVEAKLKKQKDNKSKETDEQFYNFEKSNFLQHHTPHTHALQEKMEAEKSKGNIVADYDEVSLEGITSKRDNNEKLVAELDEVMPIRKQTEYNKISSEPVILKLINNENFNTFSFNEVIPTVTKNEQMVTEFNLYSSEEIKPKAVFAAYDDISSEEIRINKSAVIKERKGEDIEERNAEDNIIAEYEEVSSEDATPKKIQNENMVVEYDEVSLDGVMAKRRNHEKVNAECNDILLSKDGQISGYDISLEVRRNNEFVPEYNEVFLQQLISKDEKNNTMIVESTGDVMGNATTYDAALAGVLSKGRENEIITEYNEVKTTKIRNDEEISVEGINNKRFVAELNNMSSKENKTTFCAYDEVSSEEARSIPKTLKGRSNEKVSSEYKEVSSEEGILTKTNQNTFAEYNKGSLKGLTPEYEHSIPKGKRKQNNTKPIETTTRPLSERFEIDTSVFEFNEDFENNDWKQLDNQRTKYDNNTKHYSNISIHFDNDLNHFENNRNNTKHKSNTVPNLENNRWIQNNSIEENSQIPQKKMEQPQGTKNFNIDDSSDNSSDAEPLIKIIDKMAVASNKSGSFIKMNRKDEDSISSLNISKQSDKKIINDLEDTELPLENINLTKAQNQAIENGSPDNKEPSSKSDEMNNLEGTKDKEKLNNTAIFDFEDEIEEDFPQQGVVHSSSKLVESDAEDHMITIASDDDDEEDEDEPIIISDVSDTKNEESIVNEYSKENHEINSGKSKPIDVSTSSIDESEEAFELPNTETSDLNDTVLSNKINTKLKMKPCKNKKSKNLKKKDRHITSPDNYCDICDKKFVRSDSLIKHKRTLTHIAKLSEIEAREAEERAKKDEEVLNEDIQKSILVPSPFSLKTNNDTLKLADIISDVLNKPVPEDNIDAFSEMQETKRYKSLGERKSFDSESIMFNPPKSTFTNHINMSNKLPHSTGAFLETQISLLENIIENKTNFQYIDEISNKSDERCSSDMSLVSDIKQDDSNIISFSHNTSIVSSIIHSDTNFVKPSQYEEISEDTRNFDEQRARKALNRDEELFLECCSLLKSSSEVSDYSKKSAKTISMVSTYGLKPGEETDWLGHKNLIAKQKAFANNEEYLSDNSRPDTPIGDNYDDFSNSNTIRTEWNSKMKEGEFEDISLDSLTNSENNSNFNSFGMSFNEGNSSIAAKRGEDVMNSHDADDDKFDDLMDDDCLEIIDDDDEDDDLDAVEISENIKSSTEPCQPPTATYTVPLPKKSDGDSSTNDSKKVMTKGAMKVFEGLKVSIPTEELDMSEVLNCSPTTKRVDLEPSIDASKEDKLENVEKSQKDNLNRFGNKLGLKITKKRVKPRASQERKLEEENKVHDIYDFEETQDNTDLFIPNNLKSFRSQLAEKKVEDKEAESDLDSNNHYVDSFSVEAQSVSSLSTETESSLSMKKNTGAKNITKKKCVIMGRIFKNAFKAKTDEIKNIPVIENVKLVENYVMNCPNVTTEGKPVNEERIKMTEQEMDLLFDKLLEENEGISNKAKLVEAESIAPHVRAPGKGRPKGSKQKKRTRKQSQSSDDEFNLNKTPKKRTARKKVKDNGINLEQELKECMGVAGRKSQRKCTSGKQNVLVEDWSSDDSEFEAMLRQSIQQSKTTSKNKEKIKETPPAVVDPSPQVPPAVTEPEKPVVGIGSKISEPISEEFLKEIVKDVNEAKPKPRRKSTAKKDKEDRLPKIKAGTIESTLASNRRKRAAADTLYYWSSSSDDDSQNLIEVKSVRDEIDEDDDRPMQHGWIVGDSPKKLVTMLAQAKGKKIDTKCVKEQSKKRTTL